MRAKALREGLLNLLKFSESKSGRPISAEAIRVPDPPPPKKSLAQQKSDFASRLALMKAEAGALGLFMTMQRMDPALRMVGFEIAGTPDACFEYERQADLAASRAQASTRERG